MTAKQMRLTAVCGLIAGAGSVIAALGLTGVPIPDPSRLWGCTTGFVLMAAAIFGGVIDSLVKKGVIE